MHGEASAGSGQSREEVTPGELAARIKAWMGQGLKPETTGRDDSFPIFAQDSLKPAHLRLNAFLDEVGGLKGMLWEVEAKKLRTGRELLKLGAGEKLQLLRALLVRFLFGNEAARRRIKERTAALAGVSQADRVHRLMTELLETPRATEGQPNPACDARAFCDLADELLRGGLALGAADLACLADLVTAHNTELGVFRAVHPAHALNLVDRYVSKRGIDPILRQSLEAWKQSIQICSRIPPEEREGLDRLRKLLHRDDDPGITAGEAWSNTVLQDFQQMRSVECARWLALLQHCQTAESSKPSKRWLKTAADLVAEIGLEPFKKRLVHWFELVALPRPVHVEPAVEHAPPPDQIITEGSATILKGLVWACSGRPDAELSRSLSTLAEVCFKKVRWLGPRCPRVGNACLFSLATTATQDSAAQLSRLDNSVKQPTAKKLIGKSLNKAAELTGQTREELEESTVPDYGIDAEGCFVQRIGNFEAVIRLAGFIGTDLSWRKSGGKSQKSVPAEVREQHPEELKKLKRTIKDIETMLQAQRARIERLLFSERDWPLDQWHGRYLNHPLLARMARSLIWHFRLGDRSSLGIWRDGKIMDVDGKALDWLAPETRVRLWHPIGFPADTVAAWRRQLEEQEIAQPFKQAHREVYVITDAELQTVTYSNRFAAHILRQHQFAALAKQRGWRYALMGNFDFQSVPTLPLPQWGLTVEYFVSPTESNETSETGISLYLATDQVRFLRDGEVISVSDVPALVFSEVLRDVDLFVSVCSVGNDPEWRDAGIVEGGNDYWQKYSFGELGATAATRRDLLSRLLPKLKIAAQCSLQDKFLVVKGSLRTYKIHLGSGNILMEPNNQYLCIVPDHDEESARRLWLPFEGDRTLGVILSKAFLLAEDSKIKDLSILRQIKTQ